MEHLEAAGSSYNRAADHLQLIPATAKRAAGVDFEMSINRQAVSPHDLLSVDLKVKPSLNRHRPPPFPLLPLPSPALLASVSLVFGWRARGTLGHRSRFVCAPPSGSHQASTASAAGPVRLQAPGSQGVPAYREGGAWCAGGAPGREKGGGHCGFFPGGNPEASWSLFCPYQTRGDVFCERADACDAYPWKCFAHLCSPGKMSVSVAYRHRNDGSETARPSA